MISKNSTLKNSRILFVEKMIWTHFCWIWVKRLFLVCTQIIKNIMESRKQGVQELQAFAYSEVSVNDEHTKARLKGKLRKGKLRD